MTMDGFVNVFARDTSQLDWCGGCWHVKFWLYEAPLVVTFHGILLWTCSSIALQRRS